MLTVTRNCEWCKRPFEAAYSNVRAGNGRYCSGMCHRQHRHAKLYTSGLCKSCGVSFEILSSRLRDGKGVYCSQACSNKDRIRQTWRSCQQCSVAFLAKGYDVNTGTRGRFCSAHCHQTFRHAQIICICLHCGSLFPRGPMKRARKQSWLYCCLQCYHSHNVGINHPGFVPDKIDRDHHEFTRLQKRKILAQDHYACRKCKKGIEEINLQIDHILPVAEGGSRDLSNGQTLCHNCHQQKTTKDNARIAAKRNKAA